MPAASDQGKIRALQGCRLGVYLPKVRSQSEFQHKRRATVILDDLFNQAANDSEAGKNDIQPNRGIPIG
jgi:hypothetical protein